MRETHRCRTMIDMAKRKKSVKKSAPKAQAPTNLMSQVGVMRLTAALLELAGQRFSNEGDDSPLDLRQFLPRVEDRRDVMRAWHAWDNTPELFDSLAPYDTVGDASMMFWLAAQIEERVEALLSETA